jgi:hypothetical protein
MAVFDGSTDLNFPLILLPRFRKSPLTPGFACTEGHSVASVVLQGGIFSCRLLSEAYPLGDLFPATRGWLVVIQHFTRDFSVKA